jgi:hypothetical protein
MATPSEPHLGPPSSDDCKPTAFTRISREGSPATGAFSLGSLRWLPPPPPCASPRTTARSHQPSGRICRTAGACGRASWRSSATARGPTCSSTRVRQGAAQAWERREARRGIRPTPCVCLEVELPEQQREYSGSRTGRSHITPTSARPAPRGLREGLKAPRSSCGAPRQARARTTRGRRGSACAPRATAGAFA